MTESEIKMKTDLIEVTEGSVETDPVIEERDRVIETLLEAAGVLKNTDVQNVECFAIIKKPLNDLLSSLKYLPSGSHFDILPTEIKTKILSHADMCDAEAFRAASVCSEWKDILKGRVESLRQVLIGDCFQCENSVCSNPVEMLKASAIHKLNIPLFISLHPITEVDPNLITEALTSVSDIHISAERFNPVMTPQQLEHLFVGLQNKKEIMNSITLINVNLYPLDQDNLATVFLKKTKKLTLSGESYPGENLMLIRKIRDSNDFKLEHLTLDRSELPYCMADELSVDLADALCKIKSVHLGYTYLGLPNSVKIIQQLFQNVLTGTFAMKTLILKHVAYYWQDLITPNDLKNMIEKMDGLYLHGRFTTEQREVAQSIPGVKVLPSNGGWYHKIEKGTF